MYDRIKLAALFVGFILAGGAAAPPAWGDPPVPPACPEAEKPDQAVKQVSTVGVVEVDESKLARIAARPPGKSRIDKLHVKSTIQKVKRGDPLADLYSPDLVVTMQNLLDAQHSGNGAAGLSRADAELARIARERLQLWGIEDGQLYRAALTGKRITHVTIRSPISGHVLRKHQVEGSYVEEGTPLFDVADLSTVWIEAEIKNQADVAVLKTKSPVRVTAQAFPKREFRGAVLGLFQDANTRTLKVRFAVKNPRQELLPGMLATVLFDAPAAPPEAKQSKLKELLQERLAASRALVKAATAAYQTGKVSFERLHQAQQALLHAQLELSESDKERITLLEEAVALTKEYEKMAAQRYKSGVVTQSDVLMAGVARLEAEIALERAKAKGSTKPK